MTEELKQSTNESSSSELSFAELFEMEEKFNRLMLEKNLYFGTHNNEDKKAKNK